jgi:NAD+ synthase (glutamine-hydrolysing)
MKIALLQNNFLIGDLYHNKQIILEGIEKSKRAGADLAIFPELALTGYPPLDLLKYKDFVKMCENLISEIAAHCVGIAAVIGAPSFNNTGSGKPLFNSAWFLNDGQVSFIANKSLLPNYDVFDEYRYFEPSKEIGCVNYKGLKLALTICEDIWNVAEIPMYSNSPVDNLLEENPDLIINISASPFHFDQPVLRKEVIRSVAKKFKKPVIYVNQIGAQTELIFDGNSMVCDSIGNIREQLSFFNEDFRIVDTQSFLSQYDSIDVWHTPPTIQLIHDALILGIRDYFSKMGLKRAILGLSGGIDSAVTLVLASEALGPENVMGILLPSEYSSAHSITDALQLAENLGCDYEQISIAAIVDAVNKSVNPYFTGLKPDVTEENIQARSRAIVLMSFANKFGCVLLNTSNKSEAAVGYGTLYGDMCGGIAVIGDLYKTDVYKLAEYINRDKVIIPVNSIIKPPSAELRPDQKDSDSLPDYGILDQVLYAYIEMKRSPAELILMGFDEKLVVRVTQMVNRNEWKRFQTPPILRISSKAFGMGRRMPIVARFNY